jgi:hypothetical protein
VAREPHSGGEVAGSNPRLRSLFCHIYWSARVGLLCQVGGGTVWDPSVRLVPLVRSVGAGGRVQISIARHEF